MRKIFITLVAALGVAATGVSQDVTGTIRNTDGKPLAGIVVTDGYTVTTTDAEGKEWDEAEQISVRSPKMDGMPRTGGVHGLEMQVAMIEKARKRAEKERDRAMRILDECEKMIDSLEDFDQRNVLRKRYIDGMEWSEVAIYANMAERTVFYVHGRALNELRRRENERTD